MRSCRMAKNIAMKYYYEYCSNEHAIFTISSYSFLRLSLSHNRVVTS